MNSCFILTMKTRSTNYARLLLTIGCIASLALNRLDAHDSDKGSLFDIVSPARQLVANAGDPAIKQSYRIQFRPEMFDYERSITPGSSWKIPLLDGSSMTFRVTDVDRKGPGRRILVGAIDDEVGSLCILAAAGKAITGVMTSPSRGRFQVEYLGDSRYRLNEIDTSALPLCATGHVEEDMMSLISPEVGNSPLMRPPVRHGLRRHAARKMANHDGSVLDMMMVYSRDALEGAGGPDGIQSIVDYSEAEANHIFANSALDLRINFVHHEALEHTETGNLPTDVSLIANNVGKLDIKDLRTRHGADLVLLLVEVDRVGWSGFAPVLKEETGHPGFYTAGVRRRWITAGFFIFTHEISHSLGCQHDRRSATNIFGDLLPGLYPNSLAHRFTSDDVTYVTAMGYAPGITLPFLSNPEVTYEGVPTGDAAEADNVATIKFSAPIVAKYETPGTWYQMESPRLDVTETEAASLEIPVSREGDLTTDATLMVRVESIDVDWQAIGEATEMSVTFVAGEAMANLNLPNEDDSVEETDAFIQLSLVSVPEGSAIRSGTTIVQIKDDDWQVELSDEDRTVFETDGELSVPLSYLGPIATG